MSQSAAAPVAGAELPTVPLGQLAPWAIFFVSADQGAISIPSGNAIHEWVHDARHLLGYPCH